MRRMEGERRANEWQDDLLLGCAVLYCTVLDSISPSTVPLNLGQPTTIG